MNRLIQRGLLSGRALPPRRMPHLRPNYRLPLRMQAGTSAQPPITRLNWQHLPRSAAAGLSGGVTAVICRVLLSAATPAASTLTQAVAVATTVALVSWPRRRGTAAASKSSHQPTHQAADDDDHSACWN